MSTAAPIPTSRGPTSTPQPSLLDRLNTTIQSGFKLFDSLDLTDLNNVKKIERTALPALMVLGTLYSLLSEYKWSCVLGSLVYGAYLLKPQEVYTQPINLVRTYLPLGDEKTGLLSLFVNTDETASVERKLKTMTQLFLAVLIANLTAPWFVKHASAAFFGYKAAEWIAGAHKAKTDPSGTDKTEKSPT